MADPQNDKDVQAWVTAVAEATSKKDLNKTLDDNQLAKAFSNAKRDKVIQILQHLNEL